MIVELCGVPGAGKTTLAKDLANEFVVIKINGKVELLKYNLLYLFKHPVAFWVNLFLVIRHSDSKKMFYYKFMNIFLSTNARYQKALKYDKSILDQGYLQNIIALFERKIDLSDVLFMKKYILLPDKVVYVYAPEGITSKRLAERDYVNRGQFGIEYLSKWHDIISYNFNILKNNLDQVGVDYLTIDNSGEKLSFVRQVKFFLIKK